MTECDKYASLTPIAIGFSSRTSKKKNIKNISLVI